MSKINFEHLRELADTLNMDSELLESFYFACRVKNLTEASMRCYAERISYLMKYGASIGPSSLDQSHASWSAGLFSQP